MVSKPSFFNYLNYVNSSRFKYLVLFGFCFAIIFGAAFTLFDTFNYDLTASPDIKTYLGLANFDFHQSPIRRYRIIIPFLAAGVNFVFGPAFNFLKPWSFPGPDFSLCMSFLVVNSLIMSLFGILVFRLCKAFGVSTFGALVGLLAVLTCRWTPYFSGLPVVDSLYFVVTTLVLLGLKTNNNRLIIIAILIGPWAKESFIFVAPLILIFSNMQRWKLVGWFLLSAVLVFSFRYYIDITYKLPINEGLESNFVHTGNIAASLHRMFSFHGAYELFSIFGMWFILFLLLFKRNFRNQIQLRMPVFMMFFLIIVIIHALLSTDLARMFYLSIPIIAIWISAITDEFLKTININII